MTSHAEVETGEILQNPLTQTMFSSRGGHDLPSIGLAAAVPPARRRAPKQRRPSGLRGGAASRAHSVRVDNPPVGALTSLTLSRRAGGFTHPLQHAMPGGRAGDAVALAPVGAYREGGDEAAALLSRAMPPAAALAGGAGRPQEHQLLSKLKVILGSYLPFFDVAPGGAASKVLDEVLLSVMWAVYRGRAGAAAMMASLEEAHAARAVAAAPAAPAATAAHQDSGWGMGAAGEVPSVFGAAVTCECLERIAARLQRQASAARTRRRHARLQPLVDQQPQGRGSGSGGAGAGDEDGEDMEDLLRLFSMTRRSLYRALYPSYPAACRGAPVAPPSAQQQEAAAAAPQGDGAAADGAPSFYSPHLVPAFAELAASRKQGKADAARVRAAEAKVAQFEATRLEQEREGGVPWMLEQFEAMQLDDKERFLGGAPLRSLHHSAAGQQRLACAFVGRCSQPVQRAAAAEIVAMGSLGMEGEAEASAHVRQLLRPLLAERGNLLPAGVAEKLAEALQLAEGGGSAVAGGGSSGATEPKGVVAMNEQGGGETAAKSELQ